jgi:hypothetical protein
MTLFLVDVEWNHKGSHYLKKHHARVRATSPHGACRIALKEAKASHPGSIRLASGCRLYYTVTVVGKEEAAQ